ncbi:MAG: hypothetical protein ABIF71_12815 [Planctomycetota bacterium]
MWVYFLQKGRIPDAETTLSVDGEAVTINLREFYTDYCGHIHNCLAERLDHCGGKLPFLVDIRTNRASRDPRNIPSAPHEYTSSHIFAVNAFFQYGLWKHDRRALATARQIMEETFRAAHENRYVSHITRQGSFAHSHGAMMVSVGALVDTLKTIDLLESRGAMRYRDLKAKLAATGRYALDQFLGYHWVPSVGFAEYIHPVTKLPWADDRGRMICDPGHTAEGVGFFAEYRRWLPARDTTGFRFNRANMLPVLADTLRFVDRYGYSKKGVMYKNIDLVTRAGTADVVDGRRAWKTAPWWNLRECAAAGIRMYALTGDARMWAIYRRAFNATYAHYPNLNIGGLELQTLDAETLRPLPFHPATGNLDPMHSPRAREREIEALEEIDA